MSKFLTLNQSDLVKGGILAVLTAALTYIYGIVQTGSFSIDYNVLATSVISALLAYLIKNLGTDQNGNTFGINTK